VAACRGGTAGAADGIEAEASAKAAMRHAERAVDASAGIPAARAGGRARSAAAVEWKLHDEVARTHADRTF
jgi:hypothetical protein